MGEYVLAVDPGFQGALAIYDPLNHRLVSCIDMPLLPKAKDKRPHIDAYALANWVGIYSDSVRVAIVENVCGHPGQSVSAMFRFGHGAGMIHGVLAANSLPIKFLQPSVWKAVLNLSPDKAKSLALVNKLFPNDAPLFSKKRDDGRAEAALMAYLGGLMIKSGAL